MKIQIAKVLLFCVKTNFWELNVLTAIEIMGRFLPPGMRRLLNKISFHDIYDADETDDVTYVKCCFLISCS